MSFLARYTSTCSDCGHRIHEGDEVMKQHGEFMHVECPEILERPPAPVCTDCWLEKPCGCDS